MKQKGGSWLDFKLQGSTRLKSPMSRLRWSNLMFRICMQIRIQYLVDAIMIQIRIQVKNGTFSNVKEVQSPIYFHLCNEVFCKKPIRPSWVIYYFNSFISLHFKIDESGPGPRRPKQHGSHADSYPHLKSQASPRSEILTWPCSSSRMLAGFRSRYTMNLSKK